MVLNVKTLDSKDYELIKEAKKIIEKNYRYGRHHIGSAVRTKAGSIFSAVHVEANVGRITVCGEAMVLKKCLAYLNRKPSVNFITIKQEIIGKWIYFERLKL